MRLVTSCPACNAAFYISPEQLAAHRGDVRCGQCEHVFNALDRLAEVDQPTTPAPADDMVDSVLPEIPSNLAESAVFSIPEVTELPPEPEASELLSLPTEAIPQYEFPAATESMPEIEPEPDQAHGPGLDPTPEIREDIRQSLHAPSQEIKLEATTLPSFNITDFSIPPSTSALSPTMMKDAARNKTGKSGVGKLPGAVLARLFFVLLVALLLLTILAQTVYYLRSDIVARWPETRPYLERACALVQCKVELPKDADLIAIDDSDLQEDADRLGLIHLYSTLVNNANHAQAYPLLELTLTDANEKPLLRRVFKPQEYLPPDTSVTAGMAARQEVSIRLSLTAGGEPVAGYRLFVTY